jgi:hypothetical protein
VKLKRPSSSLVVASIALFVALGGPAEAQRLISGNQLQKGSVNSRAVKDRSLQVRDLSRRTQRVLRRTPNTSITESKLANAAVTPGKIAPAAVGSAAVADRSITGIDLSPGAVGTGHVVDGALNGAKIADGSLDSRDLGRFSGRFRVTLPEDIPANSCWSGEPTGLAPELAGADISQDLVIVTPNDEWPEEALSFTVRNSAAPSRFVLAACNVTNAKVTRFEAGFRYLVVDLP